MTGRELAKTMRIDLIPDSPAQPVAEKRRRVIVPTPTQRHRRLDVARPAGDQRVRIGNVRIISQIFFLVLFLAGLYLATASRIGGYPTSVMLEADPLVALSTALATGSAFAGSGATGPTAVLAAVSPGVFPDTAAGVTSNTIRAPSSAATNV